MRLLVPLAALGHAGRPLKRPGVLAHRACGSRIAGLFGRRVARRVCLRPSALAGADHAPRLALAVQPHVHALFITRKVRRSAEAPRAWHPPDIGSAGPAPPLTTPHRRVAHRTFRTRLACVASHAPRARFPCTSSQSQAYYRINCLEGRASTTSTRASRPTCPPSSSSAAAASLRRSTRRMRLRTCWREARARRQDRWLRSAILCARGGQCACDAALARSARPLCRCAAQLRVHRFVWRARCVQFGG